MNKESIGSLSDEQIMGFLAQGRAEFLGEMYVRHDKMVKAALGRFAPYISEDERSDLVQDVFLALFDSAAKYPVGVDFRAWLYGMAVKKAQSWRRRTWVRRRLLGLRRGKAVGMALQIKASSARRTELRQLIEQALGDLPQDQREVILLQAVEGFTGQEIASILGLSHQAVRVRLHRARKKLLASFDIQALREMLGEDEP